jgi:hypothetical protein
MMLLHGTLSGFGVDGCPDPVWFAHPTATTATTIPPARLLTM